MDHSKKLKAQVYGKITLGLLGVGIVTAILWFALFEYTLIDSFIAILMTLAAIVCISLLLAEVLTRSVLEPINTLTKAIMHVAPDHEQTLSTAPNLEAVRTGRELVTSMALQIYQLASQEAVSKKDDSKHREAIVQAISVIKHLPLPLFVLNKEQVVTSASEAGLKYCNIESSSLFGKTIDDSLRLTFPNDQTLNSWTEECKQNKVTNTKFWERVRVTLPDETVHQCDMSAHYSRDNPSGAEFIITFFDRTEQYNNDDESLGFVAMAVHELRTPLTMLRGYIEVFEEELADSINDEMRDFMHKMSVAAGQLTIFVNNILNVARIEQNQLMMHLHEADWPKTLNQILNDMDIRAQISGVTIERHIDDNMPKVGIDTISVYEVVANLIDNALKYGKNSKKIIVTSQLGRNGLVETTVQDFGVGMPPSVTTNLFEKFYRNHQTRGKIGGTGLGLYLTKAIISAHSGQVWVQSKEGEGSTFGFSVVPYEQLDEAVKSGGNKDIVRQSHGWVKNHSMYRR